MFGRTPVAQGGGKPGRDHHPHCFSCWMAGAALITLGLASFVYGFTRVAQNAQENAAAKVTDSGETTISAIRLG